MHLRKWRHWSNTLPPLAYHQLKIIWTSYGERRTLGVQAPVDMNSAHGIRLIQTTNKHYWTISAIRWATNLREHTGVCMHVAQQSLHIPRQGAQRRCRRAGSHTQGDRIQNIITLESLIKRRSRLYRFTRFRIFCDDWHVAMISAYFATTGMSHVA